MYKANEQTLEMVSFGVEGNVIDHSWYHIVKKNTPKGKRTDSNALILLADIFYWYKPCYQDVENSTTTLMGKKYQSDILQRSYMQLEEKFGFSKDQSRSALETLEKLKIVKREFRVIMKDGVPVPNVMFIRFYHEKLLELMKAYYAENVKTTPPLSSEKTDEVIGKNRQYPLKKPTYTKTTSETSSRSLKDIDSCREKIEKKPTSKTTVPLKKLEEISIFNEMKTLGLECEDNLLIIFIRTEMKKRKNIDFLKDCIHHMRFQINSGYPFKDRIAFFRSCLNEKQCLVTARCLKNKASAEEFCEYANWNDVKITEKFACVVNAAGQVLKEIPMNIPEEEFGRQLASLYEISKGYK